MSYKQDVTTVTISAPWTTMWRNYPGRRSFLRAALATEPPESDNTIHQLKPTSSSR